MSISTKLMRAQPQPHDPSGYLILEIALMHAPWATVPTGTSPTTVVQEEGKFDNS